MQPVHAVIFDLDGTLVDTLADLGTSMNRTLEKNGFPAWPLEAYRQMVGNGMRRLTERALGEGAAPETVERILGDFLALYDRDCTRLSVPYEGMTDTLDRMREQGIALAVVTNKTEPPYTATCPADARSPTPPRRGRRWKSCIPGRKTRCLSAIPMWMSRRRKTRGFPAWGRFGASAGRRSCAGRGPIGWSAVRESCWH